jgi:hypothetical protein
MILPLTILFVASFHADAWTPLQHPASPPHLPELKAAERTWRFPNPCVVRRHDNDSTERSATALDGTSYMNEMVFLLADETKVRRDSIVSNESGHYMTMLTRDTDGGTDVSDAPRVTTAAAARVRQRLPPSLRSSERMWRNAHNGKDHTRRDSVLPQGSLADYMMMMEPPAIQQFDSTMFRHDSSATAPTPMTTVRDRDSYMMMMVVPQSESSGNIMKFRQSDVVGSYPSSERLLRTPSPKLGPLLDNELFVHKYTHQDRTWRFPKPNQVLGGVTNRKHEQEDEIEFDAKGQDMQTMLYHPTQHLPDFQADLEELEPVRDYQEHAPLDESVHTLRFKADNHLPDVQAVLKELEEDQVNFSPPEFGLQPKTNKRQPKSAGVDDE